MIFKNFRQKNLQKIGVFDSKHSKITQKFDRNIGFLDERQFFTKFCKNRRKL
jgi:hypothetical protein